MPLTTILTLATTFGTLPSVLLSRTADFRHVFGGLKFHVKLAFIYGMCSFVVSPLLGASVSRLATYGWPAFWVGVLPLMHSHASQRVSIWWIAYLILSWLPWLLARADFSYSLIISLCSVGVLTGYAVSLWCLRLQPSRVPVKSESQVFTDLVRRETVGGQGIGVGE